MNTKCIQFPIARFDTVLDNRDTSGAQRKTSLILTKRRYFYLEEKKKKAKQYKPVGKFSKKLLPCMLKQIICVL